MYSTPVLFLIFNRPDLTEEVFSKIKEIKPAKLFVAADGPRKNKEGEADLCEKTRNTVLNNIDWDCEVHTLFRDENLGCKVAVSSAISWFFDQVEFGIILEDDCLPNTTFFTFCNELLHHYKDDERIMHVAGQSFYGSDLELASYYFVPYNFIWGWATWARAWKKYDINIVDWKPERKKSFLSKWIKGSREREFWSNMFNLVQSNQFDTWDYQWTYTIWKNDGLCICPQVNLISNLGFRDDATHTLGANSDLAGLKTFELANIIHPDLKNGIKADKKATAFLSKNIYTPPAKKLINVVKDTVKKLINYKGKGV